MKHNLANRLAVGGVWAIATARRSADVAQQLREAGHTVPVGDGSYPEVMTICGVEAFQLFVNHFVIEGAQLQVRVRPVSPDLLLYNRYGQLIDRTEFVRLYQDNAYKQVAMWENDTHDAFVSTVWHGFDESHCEPPHIFETVVVRRHPEHGPVIVAHAKHTNNHEALVNHHRICALVRMGRL